MTGDERTIEILKLIPSAKQQTILNTMKNGPHWDEKLA